MKKALLCGLLVPALLGASDLKDVKSVYLYPMAGGLDQHLANRLTQDHLFRVVTDPKLADAVFTDQLGRQFEYRLDHIKRDPILPAGSPAPAPAVPVQSPAGQIVGMSGEAEPHGSSFARGKGTIFLVDAKSKQVVWAGYRQPRNGSSREMERTAKRLATNISDTLAPPSDAK